MSNGERKDEGKVTSAKTDCERLIEHIFVLLNHLQRQHDNRLQAHFDDTRLPAVKPFMLATPPCATYAEFQRRLTRIKEEGISATPSGNPAIDDLTFLRCCSPGNGRVDFDYARIYQGQSRTGREKLGRMVAKPSRPGKRTTS
jgi:hypothetical protein